MFEIVSYERQLDQPAGDTSSVRKNAEKKKKGGVEREKIHLVAPPFISLALTDREVNAIVLQPQDPHGSTKKETRSNHSHSRIDHSQE